MFVAASPHDYILAIIHESARSPLNYYHITFIPRHIIFPAWILSTFYALIMIAMKTSSYKKQPHAGNVDDANKKFDVHYDKLSIRQCIGVLAIFFVALAFMDFSIMYFIDHSEFYAQYYDLSQLTRSNIIILYAIYATYYLLLIGSFLDALSATIRKVCGAQYHRKKGKKNDS
jgi:hypothetical protein